MHFVKGPSIKMKLFATLLIASCALGSPTVVSKRTLLESNSQRANRVHSALTSPSIVKQDGSSFDPLHSQSIDESDNVGKYGNGVFRLRFKWDSEVYVTTIALGTPPQPFHAAVDLTWRTSLVVSSECLKGEYDLGCAPPEHWTYNSSQSSTFKPIGTKNDIYYRGSSYPGKLAQDTLHIPGLQIENQVFHEAETSDPTGNMDWSWEYTDGLLGLAPPVPNKGSKPDIGTPLLANLVAQGKLKSNVISIKVPWAELFEEYKDGEILFGDTDPSLYRGELTKLPLTFEDDPRLAGKWTLDAGSLHVSESSYSASLEGYTAVVDLYSPTFAIPGHILLELVDAVGAAPLAGSEDERWAIPCEDRAVAPDVTINLAGHNFTMTAWEYAGPEQSIWGEIVCPIAFSSVEAVMGPWLPQKPTVAIGVAFLHRFYTVFDLDNWQVGFAKIHGSSS